MKKTKIIYLILFAIIFLFMLNSKVYAFSSLPSIGEYVTKRDEWIIYRYYKTDSNNFDYYRLFVTDGELSYVKNNSIAYNSDGSIRKVYQNDSSYTRCLALNFTYWRVYDLIDNTWQLTNERIKGENEGFVYEYIQQGRTYPYFNSTFNASNFDLKNNINALGNEDVIYARNPCVSTATYEFGETPEKFPDFEGLVNENYWFMYYDIPLKSYRLYVLSEPALYNEHYSNYTYHDNLYYMFVKRIASYIYNPSNNSWEQMNGSYEGDLVWNYDIISNIYSSNHDIKYNPIYANEIEGYDENKVVFQCSPTPSTSTEQSYPAEMWEMTIRPLTGLVALLIPLLVCLIGLRKGLQFIFKLLRRA